MYLIASFAGVKHVRSAPCRPLMCSVCEMPAESLELVGLFSTKVRACKYCSGVIEHRNQDYLDAVNGVVSFFA